MVRTRFDRLEISGADRAGFQISGKLGFHENKKIEQLAEECLKREFKLVVFDFSELTSLGGGVARILREFARGLSEKGGEVVFVVTSHVILDFLQDEESNIRICATMNEALGESEGEEPVARPDPVSAGDVKVADAGEAPAPDEMVQDAPSGAEQQQDGIILMAYDSGESVEEGNVASQGVEQSSDGGDGSLGIVEDAVLTGSSDRMNGKSAGEAGGSENLTEGQGIISEIFSTEAVSPPDWIDDPVSPFSISDEINTEDVKELNKKLKRRILELKTLFSISADFNSIRERKKLLDIFLLTSIAQGGVESAVFYERKDDFFSPAISKGIDENKLFPIKLSEDDLERIYGGRDVFEINSISLDDETRGKFKEAGLEYVCPFSYGDGMTGLVLLGKRIAGRGMQKEDFEFMQILVNLAKGAYSNALMFERENERTLGIVKTLISLIEENTLLKGTSEIVSRYVGMVAKNMDYPEENFKDLIYGTVLRDMGMVKVSDLIVRSPRELTKEEWQIIKKHPEDGAEMLRRMKFNDHVVDVVLSHHERFNGEGYPRGLRGKEIPQGARIISIVESYAAMINERPNRPALSGREALDTLRENYGLRYDREIVNQFAAILEKEIAKSVQPANSVS